MIEAHQSCVDEGAVEGRNKVSREHIRGWQTVISISIPLLALRELGKEEQEQAVGYENC